MTESTALAVDPEFQAVIPPLSTEELAGLEASIVAEGCRDALVVWRGLIADGHHRFEICERLGLPFATVDLDLESRDEVILWIIQNQMGRRNLTIIDRCALGKKLLDVEKRMAKERVGGRPRKDEKPEAPVPQVSEEPTKRAPSTRSRPLTSPSTSPGTPSTPTSSPRVGADIRAHAAPS